MDLSHICRVCMAENLDFYDVFDTFENSNNWTFKDVIQQISPVELLFEPDDALSKYICASCRDFCFVYMKFRDLIVSSNEYLLSMQLKKEDHAQGDVQELAVMGIEQIVDDELQLEHVKPSLVTYTITVAEHEEEIDDGSYLLSDEAIDDDQFTCIDTVTSVSSDDSDRETSIQTPSKSPTKLRLYPCKTCKRKFTTEVLLTRHEIIHSDIITEIKSEVKLRCIICNAAFKEKSELEDHMREYKAKMEQKQPISCQHCDKPYNKLSNLVRHLKTHDENKTHLCNVCNKTFAMGQVCERIRGCNAD